VLGPFHATIDQILADDEDAPPKQRHTTAQSYRRLRDESGYRGVYAQVQRYVRAHRRRERETFIPLGHLPGQRLEADFGHIHVGFPEGRRLVPFLVATWANIRGGPEIGEHSTSQMEFVHVHPDRVVRCRATVLYRPSMEEGSLWLA
jgi:hypothetical protein